MSQDKIPVSFKLVGCSLNSDHQIIGGGNSEAVSSILFYLALTDETALVCQFVSFMKAPFIAVGFNSPEETNDEQLIIIEKGRISPASGELSYDGEKIVGNARLGERSWSVDFEEKKCRTINCTTWAVEIAWRSEVDQIFNGTPIHVMSLEETIAATLPNQEMRFLPPTPKPKKKIWALILLIPSLLILLWCLVIDVSWFFAADTSIGEIVGITTENRTCRRSSSCTQYFPKVLYLANNVKSYTITSDSYWDYEFGFDQPIEMASFKIGDRAKVLYNPKNPHDAYIIRSLNYWSRCIGFSLLVLFLFITYRRGLSFLKGKKPH